MSTFDLVEICKNQFANPDIQKNNRILYEQNFNLTLQELLDNKPKHSSNESLCCYYSLMLLRLDQEPPQGIDSLNLVNEGRQLFDLCPKEEHPGIAQVIDSIVLKEIMNAKVLDELLE